MIGWRTLGMAFSLSLHVLSYIGRKEGYVIEILKKKKRV